MENWLYRTHGGGTSGYNGCFSMQCRGEAIRPYGKCIVHLSDEEAQAYADAINAGREALNFASCEVNSGFVNGWLERIIGPRSSERRHMPTDLRMEGAKLIGELLLENTDWLNINLTGFAADSIRIHNCSVSSWLRIDDAVRWRGPQS